MNEKKTESKNTEKINPRSFTSNNKIIRAKQILLIKKF